MSPFPRFCPREISLHILTFVPSSDLGALMVANRTCYGLGQVALKDRLKDLIKFWSLNHATASKSALGRLILRKWQHLCGTVEVTSKINYPLIRSVIEFDRLVWSVISKDHPKVVDTSVPHPSGTNWPILITEMPAEDDIAESNPYVFIKELSKVDMSYSKSDCKSKLLSLADYNPVIIGLGEIPRDVLISYISISGHFRRLRQEPQDGAFDYSDMVEKSLEGTLRRAQSGKRMSLHEAESMYRDELQEARAVHVLKKIRTNPQP